MTHILVAAVLGVVEGLTEFLPISSTGHMILVAPLLGADLEQPLWKTFLYFIQIGAIAAVIVYCAAPLRRALLSRPPTGWSDHLLVKLAAAFLPAAVVGLALHDFLEKHLEKPLPIAVAFIIGAALMEWIERRYRRPAGTGIDQVTVRQAFLIGLAQCVSIVPGTSRALATILGGLMVGLTPEASVLFSFYLAIPTIMAAGTFNLFKHRHEMTAAQAPALAVGFVAAFVVALLVVERFMHFIRTHRLRPFGVYRVVVGLFILAACAMGWM